MNQGFNNNNVQGFNNMGMGMNPMMNNNMMMGNQNMGGGYRPIDWKAYFDYHLNNLMLQLSNKLDSHPGKAESEKVEQIGFEFNSSTGSIRAYISEKRYQMYAINRRDLQEAQRRQRNAIDLCKSAKEEIINIERFNCQKFGVPFNQNMINFQAIFGNDYQEIMNTNISQNYNQNMSMGQMQNNNMIQNNMNQNMMQSKNVNQNNMNLQMNPNYNQNVQSMNRNMNKAQMNNQGMNMGNQNQMNKMNMSQQQMNMRRNNVIAQNNTNLYGNQNYNKNMNMGQMNYQNQQRTSNNIQFGNQFVNNSFQPNNNMMGNQNQMNMSQQQMNNNNIAQNMNQNYNQNMNQRMVNNSQMNNQGMSMGQMQNQQFNQQRGMNGIYGQNISTIQNQQMGNGEQINELNNIKKMLDELLSGVFGLKKENITSFVYKLLLIRKLLVKFEKYTEIPDAKLELETAIFNFGKENPEALSDLYSEQNSLITVKENFINTEPSEDVILIISGCLGRASSHLANTISKSNGQIGGQGISSQKQQNYIQQVGMNGNYSQNMNIIRNQNQQFEQQVKQMNMSMGHQVDKQVDSIAKIGDIKEGLEMIAENVNSNGLATAVFNVAQLAIELKKVVSYGFKDFEFTSNTLENAVHSICDFKYKKLEDVVQALNSGELSSNVKQDAFSINDFKSRLKRVSESLSGLLNVRSAEMKRDNMQKQIIQNSINIINDDSKNNIQNSINIINDSSKNNMQNRDQIIEKSQEKTDKENKDKVLDLIEAHEAVSKMIELSHVSLGGLFDNRTITNFMYGCEDNIGKMGENNYLKEELSRLIKDKICARVYGHFDENLHKYEITVDGKEMKFKRFARYELEGFRKRIENDLVNITKQGKKNLGLWKDNETKLKKIIKSVSERDYDRKDSIGSSNSDNTNNFGSKTKNKSIFSFFSKNK